MRSLLGSTAVAGILVLAYVGAFLLHRTVQSFRHGIDAPTFLLVAELTAYVASSLVQALRRSGGRGWIVQRVLAVALFVGAAAMCARGLQLEGIARGPEELRGRVYVLLSVVIGAAALPIELYLARSTRRARTSNGSRPSVPASRSRPERTG